jgi:succinate-semialdehyde dehydrogenase / glutarate-semialdehyde dehydrogenase
VDTRAPPPSGPRPIPSASRVGAPGRTVAGSRGGAVDDALERYRPRLAELRGRLAAGPGPQGSHEVRCPFTGTPLGDLPLAAADGVAEAFRRARVAQAAWSRRAPTERSAPLRRFHDLVVDRRDEVLDILQLETGKARRHAFEELVDVPLTTSYYLARGPGLLRPVRRRGAVPVLTRTVEHRRPWGVVGLIVPWNYPLSIAIADAVPALLAGNAVVVKPDLQTTHTALWVAERLEEAGLPEDLFLVVSGDGPGAGGAVVELADFLAFTGSTATGRIVARRAGERLIDATLELGGKNAMIVRADADLERAVDGAIRGGFANAGQLCVGTERLLVHRRLHDAFLARFVERTRGLRMGAGLDWGADVGSLSSAAQLEKARAHVEDAIAGGATVQAGGRARPDLGPYFFEPTVLTGVRESMRVHREETFGPVVSVRPFETDDEAVELANEGRYGLNASIFGRDPRPARRLARRLEAGTVNLNEVYAAAWGSVDAPMGGMRDSGVGRRHGAQGILKFTEPQTVAQQRGVPLDVAGPWVARPALRRVLSAALKAMRRVPGLR